jgi:hypothetical protein
MRSIRTCRSRCPARESRAARRAQLAREIADHERHPPEDLADRHQAHPHDALAKIAQLPFDGGLFSCTGRNSIGGTRGSRASE